MYFLRDQYVTLFRWPLFSFALLMPLSLLGMVVSWRKSREALVLQLLAGVYAFSVVLFYVTSRYRLPIVVFLLPFAAYALLNTYETLRRRKWAQLLFCGMLFTPLYFFGHMRILGETFSYSREYANLGNFLLESDPKRAWKTYEEGIALAKAEERKDYVVDLYFAYGIGLRNQGKTKRAVSCFYSTLHYNPNFIFAHQELDRLSRPTKHFTRGNELLGTGAWQAAEKEFLQEIRKNPYNPSAHNNLGIIHFNQKRYKLSLKHFQEAAALNPFFSKAHNNIGVTYASIGEKNAAQAAWRRSLEIDSNQPKIQKYLEGL